MIRKCMYLSLFVILAGTVYCKDVAVVMVANKVVMESDVRAKMRDENRNYEEALHDLVSEKLLLLQAEKEGIAATEVEITSEINRIMKNFPDEKAFMLQLEKENIPYRLFKARIEEKIKVRKLVRKKIVEKITITSPEILKKMQEIEKAGNYSYNFKMKWFEDEPSAADFIKQFDAAKEQEMADAGWLNREEIIPEVLNGLENIGKGKLSPPVKVGARYLVLLLKDVTEQKSDVYALYSRAKNMLYNVKFSEKFDDYLKELQAKTPMFYSD